VNSAILVNLPFFAAVFIMVVGLTALLFKRNVIKVLMAVVVIEAAVNLFLVSLGYRHGGVAPIFTSAPSEQMVMPTVQALTLTNIVIGLATTAVMLSLAMRIYKYYRTTNITKMCKLKG
jgi:multicomponent Na+:H+ antiporter subunit C